MRFLTKKLFYLISFPCLILAGTCLFLFFIPPIAQAALNRNFVINWQFSNIDWVEFKDNHLMLKGFWDPELTIPTIDLKAKDFYVLAIRIRSSNPMGFMRIRWKGDSRTRFYPPMEIPLKPDMGFHTYRFDLRNRTDLIKLWKGDVSKIVITFFGFGDTIEIEELSISRPEGLYEKAKIVWENFWIPAIITSASINKVDSPFLFTLPFIFILNCGALIVGIGIIVFFYGGWGRKGTPKNSWRQKMISIVLPLFLTLWFIYDIRDIYSQAYIVSSVNNGFRKPEAKKYFFDLTDFYSFAGFIQTSLPEGTKKFYFYQPDSRNLFALTKYLLYPSVPVPLDKDGVADIHVVYKNPFVKVKDGMLYQGLNQIAKGIVIGRYDEYSFIFKEMKQGRND